MKVLCAVDGSPSSDAAVRLVGQLAAHDGGAVILYYSPPHVSVRGAPTPTRSVIDETRQVLVDRVLDRARSLLPEHLRSSCVDVIGHQKPRLGILAAAKIHRPELIAVGARGVNLLGLSRLGSVSRAVVHSSEVPVLVARERASPEADPLRILLCCDRTDLSSETARFLRGLSFPSSAIGQVMHVVESLFGEGIPDWLEAEARKAESDPIAKAYLEQHDEDLEKWKKQLAESCGELPTVFSTSRPIIDEGHPGERIVKYSKDHKVDLVVVGSRVHGAIARMFGGSTAEHVLSHAPCSILVVPHHDAP